MKGSIMELELRCFRLMLVVVAFSLAGVFGGGLFLADAKAEAARAMQTSFDEYNHYIDACGGRTNGEEWDLAVRARAALQEASARHEALESEAQLTRWIGLGGSAIVFVAFYALRWALTGRVRPLWLLGAPSGDPRGA